MMEMSQTALMSTYLEAREARVPISQMGNVERGGRFLLLSTRKTGDACLTDAIAQALLEGEVEVALDLAMRFLDFEVEADPRYRPRCNGDRAVSGEIFVP